jgi:DnaK suppressor protein
MNVQHYKNRLLELERTLSDRTEREVAEGRGELIDSAHDTADASVADEATSEAFTEADVDATVLKQVRDALARIDAGTFGLCEVDGGPIEEKRLEAVPWTPYCLKHGQQLEASSGARTPSL